MNDFGAGMYDGDERQDTPRDLALDARLSALFETWAAEPMSEALAALVARLQSGGDFEPNF